MQYILTRFTMTTRSSLFIVLFKSPISILMFWVHNLTILHLNAMWSHSCLFLLVIMSFSYLSLNPFLSDIYVGSTTLFKMAYLFHSFYSICLLTGAFSPILYLLKYWLGKLSKYWIQIILLCFLLVPHVVSFFFFLFLLWIHCFLMIFPSTSL